MPVLRIFSKDSGAIKSIAVVIAEVIKKTNQYLKTRGPANQKSRLDKPAFLDSTLLSFLKSEVSIGSGRDGRRWIAIAVASFYIIILFWI